MSIEQLRNIAEQLKGGHLIQPPNASGFRSLKSKGLPATIRLRQPNNALRNLSDLPLLQQQTVGLQLLWSNRGHCKRG